LKIDDQKMKHFPRSIEVEVEFLQFNKGGRKNPIRSGYRPQFFYDGHDWDAVFEFTDQETVEPGNKIKAYIAFPSPQAHVERIYPSMPFLIREGNRTVGFGTVTKIINLQK